MDSGKLYVIGTPIGNLRDITLRAIETLDKIEVLVCEDSRVAAKLINALMTSGRLTKKPRYIAYNEFNEDRVWSELVALVAGGAQVGLVSDAGMPTISDPGYKLIRGILDSQLPLEVIPGPTALTTALPYSGLGGEVVIYLGFLPKTRGKAQKMLEASRGMLEGIGSGRLVLYVSPHRLSKDLALISVVLGEVKCVLLRELTKQFEERVELSVSEMIARYEGKKVKGELVLILSQSSK